ncbi:hypothetical protein ACHAPU_009120 [Fusarium lateritium]
MGGNILEISPEGFQRAEQQNDQQVVELPSIEMEDTIDALALHAEKQKIGVATVLSHLALVIVPLAFIAFAVVGSRLEGVEATEAELGRWRNAIAVLATLFPLAFASIVGRLVSEIAKWKLEQGSTIGTLEQLLGSRTVGSTVITQIQLHTINSLTFGLFFIWTFSPLGAQAILRVLDTRTAVELTNSTAVQFDSDAPSMLAGLIAASPASYSSVQEQLSYLENWYSALQLAPQSIKRDSMDLWGNVKIPFLSQTKLGEDDANRWHHVPYISEPDHYSSLAGYPVANLPTGNSTFLVESNYVQLRCFKQQKQSWEPNSNLIGIGRPNSISGWGEFNYRNGSRYGQGRSTVKSAASDRTWSIAIDRFVGKYWLNSSALEDRLGWNTGTTLDDSLYSRPTLFKNMTGIESKPAHLFFEAVVYYGGGGSGGGGGRGSSYGVSAYCDIKQKYVESRIACSSSSTSSRKNCSVTQQRLSTRQNPPDNISFLSFPQIFQYVSGEWPVTTGSGMIGRTDLSLQYLTAPKHEGFISSLGVDFFKNTSNFDFSRRLSQLLNTYLLLSQTSTTSLVGSLDPDVTFLYNVTVPVLVENQVQLYVVSKRWIILCFVSCTLLLISGCLSVVFTCLCSGPEILGYASTVIRDSKLHDLPPETGSMMAIDITKAMRNERVRYGLTTVSRGGRHWLGVGQEELTRRIKDMPK